MPKEIWNCTSCGKPSKERYAYTFTKPKDKYLCRECTYETPEYKEFCKQQSIRNSGINHPQYGTHPSDTSRKKMRESHMGIRQTPESIEKIRNTLKGKMKGEKHPNYGKHPTEASRKKMSNSRKGKPIPMETRKKISDSLTGDKHPQYGKPRAEETRKKISDNTKGEKSYHWKGGITPLNMQIRLNPKMKEWRNAVFKKDNYKDSASGCSPRNKNQLEAHHIIPFAKIIKTYNIKSLEDALKCDILWDPNNGITMLRTSHIAHHEIWGYDYE